MIVCNKLFGRVGRLLPDLGGRQGPNLHGISKVLHKHSNEEGGRGDTREGTGGTEDTNGKYSVLWNNPLAHAQGFS